MSLKKKILVAVSVIMICIIVNAANAGKSVYVISNTKTSEIQAYKIEDSNLVYQTNYICQLDPSGSTGAVGLAIDESEHGNFLFATFEGLNEIELVDAESMQYVDVVEAPQASNLAGITVDKGKRKVYIIDRETKNLYVYSWDAENRELTLDYDDPYYIELDDCEDGYGLALDEENELLYVGDDTNVVKYYDTNDWSKEGEISITDTAVGIAIDVPNQYLYTGASQFGNSYYLTQYDLGSSTENRVDVNSSVMGIAVDQDTGYVYLTTYDDGPSSTDDRLMVYDPNLTKHWSSGDIGNPAGCAVSDVGYKDPFFSIVKDDNDVNCVYPLISEEEHELIGTPYNWLYYNIAWDADGYADSNVVVVDYLPKEVDEPNLISDGGVYDGNEHTVTWDLNDISANDSNEFQIRVGVNNWATPGGVITNKAQMEGDEYLSWHIIDTNVCAWGSEIIYVDKDANGFNNGTSWDDAYNLLQDGFTGARNCGAAVTAIWVAAGTYKPVWDANEDNYKNKSFEMVEDVGVFGHFGGVGTYETSTSQRNFADANNETILEGQIGYYYNDAVKYVLTAEDIEDVILDGFTIKGSYNGAGLYLYYNVSDVSVVNCKFKNNHLYGIHVNYYCYPDIHNCTFIDNSNRGVYSVTSEPDISYCIFDGNNTTAQGLNLTGGSTIDVTDSVFKNHTNDGIYGSNATLTVTNSVFENNNDSGLELYTDVTTTLTNCSIKNSGDNGIYASDSDLTMEHCVIDHSTDCGIYMVSNSNLTLKGSVVRHSGEYGIYLSQNSATAITNNWVHNNGTDHISSRASGIYFNGQIGVPLVRNNTIYGNYTYGIESSEIGGEPNIINCIIYANDSNDLYRENEDFETVNYCCLEDGHAGTGNITTAPTFKNPTNPNDLHQDKTSATKDAGDPNADYGNETDIDGETRIIYGRVDMGADEYYWSPADFDESGNVDFVDYSILAAAWQSEPNDDNYNEDCDLADNNSIDYNDLALFCEDWLWEAGWDDPQWMMCMGGAGRGMDGSLMLLDVKVSLKARPERLATRSQKFYDITPTNTISALRKAEEVKRQPVEKINPPDIEQMIKWLEGIWLDDDELRKTIDEDDWKKFMESL